MLSESLLFLAATSVQYNWMYICCKAGGVSAVS